MLTEEMKLTLNNLGVPVHYSVCRQVTEKDVDWLTRYFNFLGYKCDVAKLVGTNIYY